MFGVEEEEEEAEVGRLLPGLRASVSPPAPPARSPFEPVPLPRIEDIVERIEHPQRRFPVERAILISLILHVLLLAFLILHPNNLPFRTMVETPEQRIAREKREAEFRVPVKFYAESPGPSRRNSNPNAPPSDKTRRAGGGDKSKPRAETPLVAEKGGIQGLRPGEKSPPGSAASRSASAQNAQSAPPPSPATSTSSAVPGQASRSGPNLNNLDMKKAIQAAAGNPFAGEGGAPNASAGGFVDSGPISFDTQWYDWGDYAEEMIRRIKLHWEVPQLARMGVKGKLSVRFYIRADGRVEEERILRDSTIPPFDHAAFQAIATSSPFRPLPKDLHEDREGVTVTFYYNIRPGEEGKVP